MLQIDELVIRVPAMVNEQGNLLGREVAQKVAALLPPGLGNHRLPELKIRVMANPANDITALSDDIAAQIIQQIKYTTYSL